ncbi:uncharacterized protein LOC133914345 [Phragmites australis]|uniref:uncharacterized protein LOC133914345 n=1 Tax=Phragmites australis TaxID=29695 RepID=UPI002D770936|nr:uncharacterized protein LOC133914345 [Phragmites australis]
MDSKRSVQHGHHHHNGVSKPPVHHHHHGGGGRRGWRPQGGGGGRGIKVVYISSPMKITASAEEFRAVVQELTGRDSNVADHDLATDHEGVPSSSSTSSSSSYSSSFGRVSPTAAVAAGVRALLPTMATANAGPGRAAEYAGGVAPPPAFQGMYDETAGTLLYGQDYW